MLFWTIVAAGLAGWAIADFESWGFVLGAFFGAPMGAWLRGAVRGEIARAASQERERLEEVLDRLNSARAALAELPAAAAGIRPAAPLPETAPEAEPEPEPEVAAQSARSSPWEAAPAERLTLPPVAPVPEPDTVHESRFDMAPSPGSEWLEKARDFALGGNTILRAGLAILFVGLTFLVRYVANAGLFPIELRLALVGAAGVGLLVVGFNRRAAKPTFGLSLQGTGVAVLYLTVFAAARGYGLMPPAMAFALMILFCALGCALALMQDSLVMAFASFLGGFAVPVLLGGDSRTPLPLFAYFTVLNLAIMIIAWRRSWRPLNLLGFAATFGLAAVWGFSSYGPQHYLTCQIFLGLSVAIYLATALLYAHSTPGRLGNAADSTLLFGPALAGFGLQVGLVRDLEFGSAFAALAFGAAYLAVAGFALRQRRAEMRLLTECLLAIGVGFVTLAVPLALDAKWTSSAWALEGAGALWVGSRQARWMPRAFGLLLQVVAAVVLLGNIRPAISAIPFGNSTFLNAALVALPLLASAWWLRRPLAHSGSDFAKSWETIERSLGEPVFLGGFAFTGLGLLLEVRRLLPGSELGGQWNFAIPQQFHALAAMLAILLLMALFAWIGRKRDWAVASWPARVSLPVLVLGFLATRDAGRHVLSWPEVIGWALACALHIHLLRASEARREPGSLAAGWAHFCHAGSVWLFTAMLADSLDLGIDRAGLWDTSWAGVAFLISVTLVLMGLTRWAGQDGAKRWPLAPHAPAYGWTAAVPLAVLAYGGALVTALGAEGVTDPLPYVPLLNPVDLAVLLALAALALWRRMVAAMRPEPQGAEMVLGNGAIGAALLLAFVEANAIWLRTAHHWLGVGWSPFDLEQSAVVQTGLSILWTLLAMGLMLFAHRRAMRGPWLVGAGLLGVVVAKLLLVDMSNAQGWERIVTFIGVGLLMLVIGYFVPLPPRQDEPAQGSAA